ncbi:MAG: hypothetical protein HGA22_01755 [Clostridiales bacterium]|nr:hypothetical protein [Clostridiales bacterium]
MKTRLVLRALFRARNIGILAVLAGLASLLTMPLIASGAVLPFVPAAAAYSASLVVYIIMVLQSLLSKDFHEKFNRSEKLRNIQNLNYSATRLSNDVKKNTNTAYKQKLKKVMEDKEEILQSYLKGGDNFLKERITEQTLNLIVSYMHLLDNFCRRNRELSAVDVSAVAGRINANIRKLDFVKDVNMSEDLKKVIEMDEKLITRMKDEKKELERIGAKLDYMESTVNMFKHQILSSVESEDMLETLEKAVNEAEALDNVLEDRRKSKRRV